MTGVSSMIRDVDLIDGWGGPLRRRQTVVIVGRRIEWIGPAEDAPAFVPPTVIDGRGCSLLPGLINSHVHLSSDAGPDLVKQVVTDSVAAATLRAAAMAEATLQSGVTTVRDCGAARGVVIELAAAVATGLTRGPRINAAGRVITMTGGHGYFIGREADGVDAVRRAVRDELKIGADFIKVVATGGVLTPRVKTAQSGLLLDELTTAVQEAHNAGRRVAAHAIGIDGIKNAIQAGVDSIEHGIHLDDEVLDLALDRGVYLVPTLLAIDAIVAAGTKRGVPADVVEKAVREAERSRDSFIAAVRSGLRIAAGTDAGTPFNHHSHLARELRLMVELGLTESEAVVAATRHAAGNLDLLSDVGTVEKGKLADLLMVEGDPHTDVDALERVRLVVKDGKIVRHEPGIRSRNV